jgi:cobalamin biosynthesis Mg chelatase CobN
VTFGIVPPSLLSTLRFSSTTPTTSQFTWALTEDQRIQFEAEFEQNDTDKDGFLSGDQSRDIFLKTGVPVEDLFNIWKLADRDGDSRLSEVEYIIARFLIFARQQGQSIPTKLPDSLIQSLVETDPQSRKKSKKLQKLQNSPSFLKKITRTGSKDLSSEKTKPSKDKEKEKDKKEKKKTPRTEESGDKKKTVKEKKNKEKTDSKKEAGENPKVPPSSATTKDKSSAASSHALEKSTPSSSSSSMTSKTKKPVRLSYLFIFFLL